MGFRIYPQNYSRYILSAYKKIHSEKDYLSELDAATGDGDHWANINMGFAKLAEEAPAMAEMTLAAMFQKIAMTMMTVIGGSSGVLYASAYMEAAKKLSGVEYIDCEKLYEVLEAMDSGIMKRGNATPGMKTMIDTIHPAVLHYKECLGSGVDERALLEAVRAAAYEGQQSTSAMEAVRGRAYYRPDKGVGHLDPGAVSMYYQLDKLVEEILQNCF